jgi:ABC-type Zn uptake system ZnuABC Zn-binding protein ZnuA
MRFKRPFFNQNVGALGRIPTLILVIIVFSVQFGTATESLNVYVVNYFARRYGLNIVSVHWEPDQVPSDIQLRELKGILKQHPAQWMIWEGKPTQASVDKLKTLEVDSLVFEPCSNVPDRGDFMTVMQRNVDNLRKAFN